jgi:hypothetical protein
MPSIEEVKQAMLRDIAAEAWADIEANGHCDVDGVLWRVSLDLFMGMTAGALVAQVFRRNTTMPSGYEEIMLTDADGMRGWPRYYFNLVNAMSEIIAWLDANGGLRDRSEEGDT